MSSLNAALLTIGLFVIIIVPVFYFIFKSDSKVSNENTNDLFFGEFEKMSSESFDRIGKKLNLEIPKAYAELILKNDAESLFELGILPSEDQVIESTQQYRSGFSGLKKWPEKYLYIGDFDDACPIVIDCNTEEVIRVDNGQIDKVPLETFKSIRDFVKKYGEGISLH